MLKLNISPFLTLNTNRLKLRQLEFKDADIIYNYQSNKETTTNEESMNMVVYQLKLQQDTFSKE
jgi:hypothetical protein